MHHHPLLYNALAHERELDLSRSARTHTCSDRPIKRKGTLICVAATLAAFSGLAVATFPTSSSAGFARVATHHDVQARAVIRLFFQTINAREFAKTCDLMSVRFYRLNHVPDKRHCVLGLTAGLTMSPTVFYRIITVRRDGEQTVVRAAANGAAGKIVLISEHGRLKILSVGS